MINKMKRAAQKGGKRLTEGKITYANGKKYQMIKESQSSDEMEQMIIGIADQVLNAVADAQVDLTSGAFSTSTRVKADLNYILDLGYDMDLIGDEIEAGDGRDFEVSFVINKDGSIQLVDRSVEGLYVSATIASNGRANISGEVDVKTKMPQFTVADLINVG